MNTQAPTLWLTGLSASGKTTIARILHKWFLEAGIPVEVLDGDELRRCLSIDLGYSKQDRDSHIRRIAKLANLLTRQGVVVIVAAISPYRSARHFVRSETANLIEIYCGCSVEVAEQRDTKGNYAQARRQEIQLFTRISDPYGEPLMPEIVVNTDSQSVIDSARKIWAFLRSNQFIGPRALLESV